MVLLLQVSREALSSVTQKSAVIIDRRPAWNTVLAQNIRQDLRWQSAGSQYEAYDKIDANITFCSARPPSGSAVEFLISCTVEIQSLLHEFVFLEFCTKLELNILYVRETGRVELSAPVLPATPAEDQSSFLNYFLFFSRE